MRLTFVCIACYNLFRNILKEVVTFMTERDLMRLFEEYDGEVSMSDFAPEELEEMLGYKLEELDALKKKYFDFYDDVKSQSLRRQDW